MLILLLFYLLVICVVRVDCSSIFASNVHFKNVEYANAASNRGGNFIGIRNTNYSAILYFSNSSQSSPSSNELRNRFPRIKKLSRNFSFAYIGINSDGKHISRKAQDYVNAHYYSFDRPPPPTRAVKYIADYIHKQTLYSRLRPFGISLCFASFDDIVGESRMQEVDCFGNIHDCQLTCSGKLEFPILIVYNVLYRCHNYVCVDDHVGPMKTELYDKCIELLLPEVRMWHPDHSFDNATIAPGALDAVPISRLIRVALRSLLSTLTDGGEEEEDGAISAHASSDLLLSSSSSSPAEASVNAAVTSLRRFAKLRSGDIQLGIVGRDLPFTLCAPSDIDALLAQLPP